MPKYVDGFVVPVPKQKVDAYRKLARGSAKIWREHGAISVVECGADDVPYGKVTSFPRSVERKNSETVVFSWITYKSRADRDKVNAKVMADPRLEKFMQDAGQLMDPARMIFGGFTPVVTLEA